MFQIKGKIKFDPRDLTKKHNKQSSWKKVAIIEFNDDIPEYYSWFIQRRFNLKLNKPLRGSHMTFINDIIDDDIVYSLIKKQFDNKEIEITYDPSDIRSNRKGHWWMKSYSEDIKSIRELLNLGDNYHGLHITIGQATHLELEHSLYLYRMMRKFNI